MIKKNLNATIALIVELVLMCQLAVSERAIASRSPPKIPTDFSKVDIFLATRDLGPEVYSKYGHTIVRVINHQNYTDIGYNWGTFDFGTPDFLPQFLKGILIYRMSFGPWQEEVEGADYDHQTLWMEQVNFTTKQKEIFVRRIYSLAEPQNINYQYYFFRDNCATRVRDLFDEALHGRLKLDTSTRMIGKSYRDRVIEHNASIPIFAMGQDVILNSEPDQKMSEWDDMFIPIYLREYLLRAPAVDDAGQVIPGKNLISDTQQLTTFARSEIPIINGYAIFWLLAGLPAILSHVLLRFSSLKKTAIRLSGFAYIILGGVWGLFGLFMALSWTFGSHTVLPHNANLWLMWPTDILYLMFGLALLWRGRWVDGPRFFRELMLCLTRAHFLCIIIFVVAFLANLFTQDVSRVAFWFAPLSVIVLLPSLRMRR